MEGCLNGHTKLPAPAGRNASVQLTTTRKEPVRVAIVDGDQGEALRVSEIIVASGEFACVGCFATGEDAISGVATTDPQIVLVEVALAGISGIQCARLLKNSKPGLIVVATGCSDGIATCVQAFQAGSDNFLTRPFTVAQCLAALRFAYWRHCKPRDFGSDVRMMAAVLTERESDVIQLLSHGLLYKEIADRLQISVSTVHKHQHNIFGKLRVSNRTEAVREWAMLATTETRVAH
jgi:DNA-binding NarL/FixJ family response regulator